MDRLQTSIQQASTYPSNLVCLDTPRLILDGIRQELQSQAERIFCDEETASVDVIEGYHGERGSF